MTVRGDLVLVRGVRLGPRTVERLDELSKEYGFSRARLIRAAVANYLNFVYEIEPEFEDPASEVGLEWAFDEPEDWSEPE